MFALTEKIINSQLREEEGCNSQSEKTKSKQECNYSHCNHLTSQGEGRNPHTSLGLCTFYFILCAATSRRNMLVSMCKCKREIGKNRTMFFRRLFSICILSRDWSSIMETSWFCSLPTPYYFLPPHFFPIFHFQGTEKIKNKKSCIQAKLSFKKYKPSFPSTEDLFCSIHVKSVIFVPRQLKNT